MTEAARWRGFEDESGASEAARHLNPFSELAEKNPVYRAAEAAWMYETSLHLAEAPEPVSVSEEVLDTLQAIRDECFETLTEEEQDAARMHVALALGPAEEGRDALLPEQSAIILQDLKEGIRRTKEGKIREIGEE